MTDLNMPLRYCLYARKSSESDERQAMSIDSQIKEMLTIAEKEQLQIVEIKQESKSAKEKGIRTKLANNQRQMSIIRCFPLNHLEI